MHTKSVVRFLALLVIVALAIPAVAKPISKSINISQTAKFGTKQLKAGEYRLLIDGTKVTVQQGRNVLAEIEGRWEQRGQKAQATSVLLGSNGEVQEVRFAGESRVLVLSTP